MFRSKPIQKKIIAVFFAAFLFFPRALHADFRLRDAIQEFGEKRFVETTPGGHIKAGPIRIHPHLTSKASYDSNILREKNDGREDVLFNIRPGAIIELPIDKHQIAVGYEADFENFVKRTDQNDQNQNFFALADFRFPDWYVNILEELTETSDRAGTTFTTRIPRIDQNVNPKVGYKWKRFTFEAGYRNFLREYRKTGDKALNFKVNEISGVIYYDLFARLKALFDYQLAFIDYPNVFLRNATVNQFRFGVEGEIYPNVKVKVRSGPQFRNYTSDSEHDFYSWVLKSLVEYQMRTNFKLHVFFNREPVEATFGDVNFYKEYSAGAGYVYNFRPQWAIFTDATLTWQRYAERATVGDNSGYRHDRILGLKPGIRYLLNEFVQFELAYEFYLRNSNFKSLEYTDHIVSLTSKLSY